MGDGWLGMARAVRAARSRADEADRGLLELVRGIFPVGAEVRWSHGDAVRSGTVVDASGLRFGSLRFRIRSGASGRVCWVGAGRLLSFAGL